MRKAGSLAVLLAIICGIFAWRESGDAPTPPAAEPSLLTTSEIIATSTQDFVPVIRDIDGDTIVVLVQGATTTVRLLGVDTPETVDPRKPVECFGPEASAETKKLVDGQLVRLLPDPSQGAKDKYGRALAYVYLEDGTLFDEFLIAQGYGHEYTYKTPYEYQSEFKAAQAKAQKEQLGLWSPTTCAGKTGVTSAR